MIDLTTIKEPYITIMYFGSFALIFLGAFLTRSKTFIITMLGMLICGFGGAVFLISTNLCYPDSPPVVSVLMCLLVSGIMFYALTKNIKSSIEEKKKWIN